MEKKEAIEIITGMVKKYPLTEKEKEALIKAIGAFGWNGLTKGVIRARKPGRKG